MRIRINSILLLSILAAFLMSACSSANVRVMPGPDGTITVVARDATKYDAEQAAFEAAKSHCADRGKETVFLADDVEYKGDMDESDRESVRQASESATILAGVIRATDARDAAAIFEGGAAVGRSATSGKDYRAEVRFTCEDR